MNTLNTFGDIKTFAIHCMPYRPEKAFEGMEKMAFCHLIINGALIGDPEETCYLPTWLYLLSRQRDFIEVNQNDFFIEAFEDRTDREIFELILKANELEEEFNSNFLYLPQLDNEVWSRHRFSLDETIDAYLFYYYVKDGHIHFLLEDRTTGDRKERTENFIFSSAPLVDFTTTIDQAIAYLQSQYPYLLSHRNK